MDSPYNPPKSQFAGSANERGDRRTFVAAIFSVFPAIALFIFQGNMLYTRGEFRSVAAWEPTLFILPFILLVAASGYFTAARCAKASQLGILLVGMLLGGLWILEILFAFASERGGDGNAWYRVSVVMFPLSCSLCAWSRHHGRGQSNS